MNSIMEFLRDKGAGRMKEMSIVCIVLMIVIAASAPHKVGVMLWALSKLTAGSVFGYWTDRLAYRADRRPHMLSGAERTMAEQRRAWIIAASILAMALLV